MLFPAAVLILVVMAALVVDTSIAFLGHRELANATAAAANDAAAQGLSEEAFYTGNRIELDFDRTQQLAVERVRRAVDGGRHRQLSVDVGVTPPASSNCPWTVTVRATARVDYVFANALPGGPDHADVSATSTASPRQDDRPGCG